MDCLRPPQAGVHLKRHQALVPLSKSTLGSHMIWAACCLGFFSFLLAGEFTVPSVAEFDQGEQRMWWLTSTRSPCWIKQSKTDPLCRGVDIYIGKASTHFAQSRPRLGTWLSEALAQGLCSSIVMAPSSLGNGWWTQFESASSRLG